MDGIPVLCFACDLSIPEKEYPVHMEKVHGGATQQQAMSQKKLIEQNTPADNNLPPGVKPEDLPDESFLETLAEMQRAEQEKKQQPINPPPLSLKPEKPAVANPGALQTPSTPSKIDLTYKYIGNCENGHSVSTLEMDVAEKHFAIAFCLQCNKQLENREVVNLKIEKSTLLKIAESLEKNSPFNNTSFAKEDIVNITLKKAGRPKKT